MRLVLGQDNKTLFFRLEMATVKEMGLMSVTLLKVGTVGDIRTHKVTLLLKSC